MEAECRERKTSHFFSEVLLPVILCLVGSPQTVTPGCTGGLMIFEPLLSSFLQCTLHFLVDMPWCKQLKEKCMVKKGRIIMVHVRDGRIKLLKYDYKRGVFSKGFSIQLYFQASTNSMCSQLGKAFSVPGRVNILPVLKCSRTKGCSGLWVTSNRLKHATWKGFGARFGGQSSCLNDIHF